MKILKSLQHVLVKYFINLFYLFIYYYYYFDNLINPSILKYWAVIGVGLIAQNNGQGIHQVQAQIYVLHLFFGSLCKTSDLGFYRKETQERKTTGLRKAPWDIVVSHFS